MTTLVASWLIRIRSEMDAVAVIGSATMDRVVQGGASVYKRGGVVAYAGLTFAE